MLAERAVFMVRHLRLSSLGRGTRYRRRRHRRSITGLTAGRLQRRLGDSRTIAVGTLAVAASVAFFPAAHSGVTGSGPVLVYEFAALLAATSITVTATTRPTRT